MLSEQEKMYVGIVVVLIVVFMIYQYKMKPQTPGTGPVAAVTAAFTNLIKRNK